MKLPREGVELAWESTGAGPALLLLHAFPLDRSMWSSTVRALAGQYRVMTMDLRGFGESTLGEAASLIDFADDAAAVLDAAGVPMAALAGLSMGGYVALAFAERHPARLSALILADTRSGPDSQEARRTRDEGIAQVQKDGALALVAPQPARLLSAHAPPTVRTEALAIMRRQPVGAIANALAAMRDRPDRTRELAEIACPTLVLVGAEDTITPPGEARALAQQIPGARLRELADAGHLSNLEAPEAFDAALAEFLDEAFPH